MERCRTCRFWEPGENDSKNPDCARFPGTCQRTEVVWHGYEPSFTHPETLAVAKDSEMYAAVLCTSPDFGCVMHESAFDAAYAKVIEENSEVFEQLADA